MSYHIHWSHAVSMQDVGVSVAKVSSTWTTTAHCCLFNTASHLIEDIKQINGR